MTSEELENRLIHFAVNCIKVTKHSDQSFASQYLCSQLIRSATSVALNYSEVIAAKSARDYIHKMQICLKELRESKTN
ncbi:four helix bundle protein [Mesonia aestuariivivens]|uniref:Four helix bundle protein n=1 Tax=Mesonia aestuariivivens TaxID=2796128 RepID=A0ABS6W3B9_9FLAO|nr:four helix bundle protein [Mesonia aestuariivivens]MBW2962362.1 four helix bundle protein [Mesonia aestuariivivens]